MLTTEQYNQLSKAIQEDKDWLERVTTLCGEYFQTYPAGGIVHVVLADGNLDDSTVDWTAGFAAGCEDVEAQQIADLLRGMAEDQRERLYAKYPYYDSMKVGNDGIRGADLTAARDGRTGSSID